MLKTAFSLNQADIGGVIYTVHQSNISITNSSFINNSATFEYNGWCICASGGGVLHSDGTSAVNISHSRFIGNRALESGGVVSVVGYGRINSDTSIIITDNSTFTDNSAGEDGGVVSIDQDMQQTQQLLSL